MKIFQLYNYENLSTIQAFRKFVSEKISESFSKWGLIVYPMILEKLISDALSWKWLGKSS